MYENYGWKYVLTVFITVLFGWALVAQPIALGIDLKGGSEMLYRLDTSTVDPKMRKTDLTDTTIQVLQNRLDALAIKELSIRKQGEWDIVIQVPGASPDEVNQIKNTVSTTGLLEFKLVVGKEQLGSDAAIEAEIKNVEQKKADGTWQRYIDDTQPFDRFDIARDKTTGHTMLLENKGVSGRFLRDAHRTIDQRYKPAVGFEWGSVGKTKFYDMTSNNVGRAMAIVLDGIAQSAPYIRSAIGESGIIEGGSTGFDEDEVKRLIVILKAGALPAKPVFQYEQKVGATLGQAAITWGGIATIASMLAVLAFMLYYYKVGGFIANIALVLNIALLLGTLAMFGATLTLPGIAGILLTAGMAVDANILIFERMREEKARPGTEVKTAIEIGYDRAFWTIFDSHVTTLVTGLVLYWTGTGPIRGFAVTLIIGISISLFTSLFVTKMIYGWLGSAGDLRQNLGSYLVTAISVAGAFSIVAGLAAWNVETVIWTFIVLGPIAAVSMLLPVILQSAGLKHLPEINFRHLIESANFDFMGFYPKAVTGALVLINIGFVIFLLRGDEKYGIDFTGGSVVQMRLSTPLEKSDLDHRIEAAGIKEYDTQRVGDPEPGGIDKGYEFQIRTRKLAEQLGVKVDLTPEKKDGVAPPSTASATDKPENKEELLSQDLFRSTIEKLFKSELIIPYPVTPGAIQNAPYAINDGGADGKSKVRFMVNLVPLTTNAPELTEASVREAIKAELNKIATDPRTTLTPAQNLRKGMAAELAGSDFDVKDRGALPGRVKTFEVTTAPVTSASDVQRRAYDVSTEVLARNASCTIADPFPRVAQIGGAVAKNLKSKAFMAMIAAIIAVVLYVAFRFEFIWGIGAILSLVHDLLTTIGFLAILDAFFSITKIDFDAKINLPTVAAFLTLLGYSITDTIVVYDRIREKIRTKGLKFADAKLINEAINGTLSRTILTSLTVFLVALVLFFCSFADLKVIQGFSVAMCFGVVTGTFSSIFIAAPVILSDARKLRNLVLGEAAFLAAVALIGWLM